MPALQPWHPGRCPRCGLPHAACLCAELPEVRTSCEVLLLRHWKEAFSSTNTARLAALALPRAELHDYGAPPPHAPLPALEVKLTAPDTWLLFPGGEAAPPTPRPQRLVVVDGSWRQAAKMVGRVPGLAALPRWSPSPGQSERLRVRLQHHPEGMATLEAVARAVALLDGEDVAAPLERLFDRYVQEIQRLRTYRTRLP
ncbi:MAG: DTW domain-containing protein [Alphaproteobacteria bacterium]|nr:DTW domain-containing protein [Alphaproteobacteria bacterium]MCB9796095.1 DTW domain-containing protein [Alphaproteobacteria bacterium]